MVTSVMASMPIGSSLPPAQHTTERQRHTTESLVRRAADGSTYGLLGLYV